MPKKKSEAERQLEVYKKLGKALFGLEDKKPSRKAREEKKAPRRRGKPSPEMLGSGMARKAGRALSGRRAQLERQEQEALGLINGRRR